VLGLLASTALAQDSPGGLQSSSPTKSVAEAIAAEVRTVFERARKAIVKIEGRDEHGHFSGTGFFVDPAGTLYTSYTIGGGDCSDLVVCLGEQKYPARRFFADSRSGIAVLKLDAETPFLSIASPQPIAVASPVVVVGYAMDLPISPGFGVVAGLEMKFEDRYFATRHIRANVPVQRGQGGAPLLNMRGEVVGIVISSLDQGSACFALPIQAAEKVRKDFVRHGETRPGWLGIGIEPAPITATGSTAAISTLNPGSPSEKVGLQRGDVVLQINNHSISSPEDVLNASFFIAPEDEVKLRVARGQETLEFEVTAGDRPNTKGARTAGDVPTFAPIGTSDLRALIPSGLDR
jgi:serine protease Do